MSIGEPKATNATVIKLAHFSHNFINRIQSNLLSFHNGINAIAAVMGATTLGLNANVEITSF